MPSKKEMINDINKKIDAEKVERELADKVSEISALSSGDIKKYELLTNKDILPSSTEMIIQEKKFDYSPLGKKLDEQVKTIKETSEKQVDVIKKTGNSTLLPIDDKTPQYQIYRELMDAVSYLDRSHYTYHSFDLHKDLSPLDMFERLTKR